MNHRAHPVPNRSALFRFVAIFIALIAAAAATACGSGSSSDQGAEAPDFSLPVANGAGKITLSHYQGDKNVILVFYRGHFWGICLGQLVELQRNYNRIRNYDAEILAVSMDDFQGAGTMIANSRAFYPFLYTTKDPAVPELYDVYNLHGDLVAAPAVFIIDKNGKIAYSYIGIDIADRAPTDEIITQLQKIERG